MDTPSTSQAGRRSRAQIEIDNFLADHSPVELRAAHKLPTMVRTYMNGLKEGAYFTADDVGVAIFGNHLEDLTGADRKKLTNNIQSAVNCEIKRRKNSRIGRTRRRGRYRVLRATKAKVIPMEQEQVGAPAVKEWYVATLSEPPVSVAMTEEPAPAPANVTAAITPDIAALLRLVDEKLARNERARTAKVRSLTEQVQRLDNEYAALTAVMGK